MVGIGILPQKVGLRISNELRVTNCHCHYTLSLRMPHLVESETKKPLCSSSVLV